MAVIQTTREGASKLFKKSGVLPIGTRIVDKIGGRALTKKEFQEFRKSGFSLQTKKKSKAPARKSIITGELPTVRKKTLLG